MLDYHKMYLSLSNKSKSFILNPLKEKSLIKRLYLLENQNEIKEQDFKTSKRQYY